MLEVAYISLQIILDEIIRLLQTHILAKSSTICQKPE